MRSVTVDGSGWGEEGARGNGESDQDYYNDDDASDQTSSGPRETPNGGGSHNQSESLRSDEVQDADLAPGWFMADGGGLPYGIEPAPEEKDKAQLEFPLQPTIPSPNFGICGGHCAR